MGARILREFSTRLRRKPRLPILRSRLLRKMDQAVEECAAGVLPPVGQSLWAACRIPGEGGDASSLRSLLATSAE